MSAKSYRYFRLDGVGDLHSAEWFEADSDDVAIAMVREKHPGDHCEIWEGRRLAASVGPRRLPASSSLSATLYRGDPNPLNSL